MSKMNSPNRPNRATDEARPRQADAMPSPDAAGPARFARKFRRWRIALGLVALLLLWSGAKVWWQEDRRQDEAVAHYNLGNAQADKGDLDDAIASYKEALELDPEFAPAHHNLGGVLYDKGDLDGAIACYKKALNLDPKYASAHYNLGNALKDKGDLDAAIACYKQAIDLDPKYAPTHYNLGNALKDKGDLDAAIACYKQAIDLDPKYAPAHNNLGIALGEKGDLDGAIACYKKALDLDPKHASAHYNLGNALADKGDLEGAIACYKKALDLDPKHAKTHNNLGNALKDKGDLDGALACFHKALELDPKFAQAWGATGLTLQMQGRYAEARDATRRALALLPSSHPLRRTVVQQLHSCEQYLALDGKLPAILQGMTSPANAGEAVTLAQMCKQHKRWYVAAARLYADAFAAEPKLAVDLNRQHRYHAACSAALAAAGQGADVHLLPDKVVTMFRHWARGWLRDDLTAYAKRAEQNNPTVKQAIRQRLAHWRQDPDLISVRDRLPENERAAWQTLWRDVDELAKRVEPEGRSRPPAGASGR